MRQGIFPSSTAQEALTDLNYIRKVSIVLKHTHAGKVKCQAGYDRLTGSYLPLTKLQNVLNADL